MKIDPREMNAECEKGWLVDASRSDCHRIATYLCKNCGGFFCDQHRGYRKHRCRQIIRKVERVRNLDPAPLTVAIRVSNSDARNHIISKDIGCGIVAIGGTRQVRWAPEFDGWLEQPLIYGPQTNTSGNAWLMKTLHIGVERIFTDIMADSMPDFDHIRERVRAGQVIDIVVENVRIRPRRYWRWKDS